MYDVGLIRSNILVSESVRGETIKRVRELDKHVICKLSKWPFNNPHIGDALGYYAHATELVLPEPHNIYMKTAH